MAAYLTCVGGGTCCSFLWLSQHPGEQADPATAQPEELPCAGPFGKDTTGRPREAFIPQPTAESINNTEPSISAAALTQYPTSIGNLLQSLSSSIFQSRAGKAVDGVGHFPRYFLTY